MQSATALLPLLGDSGTLHLISDSPGSTGVIPLHQCWKEKSYVTIPSQLITMIHLPRLIMSQDLDKNLTSS